MISESIIAFKLSSFGFFLGMLTWWVTSIPTGMQRFDIFNFISIIYGTLNIGGNLFAAWAGYSIIGIVISNIVSNLIALLLYFFYTKRLIPYFKIWPAFDFQIFKTIFNYSLYMIGFSVFAIIFSQLDKTLIGIFIGTTAVTYYVIPLSISSINQQVNGKIMQVFFPMASELSAKNEIEKLQILFLRSLNFSIIIGLCLTIPFVSFSYPILQLWISTEMAVNSQYILIFLVIAFLLGGIIPYNIVAAMGYPKYFTYSAIVSGMSGAIFFFILIKPLGNTGAALAKFLSMFLTMFYYIYISNKILKIGVRKIMKIFFLPFSSALILIFVGRFYASTINSVFILGLYSALLILIFISFILISNQLNKMEKKLIQGYFFVILNKLRIGNSN
jgi:O-antigen/teichoic acid export membrane protein